MLGKSELLGTLSGTNRGIKVSNAEKESILDSISQLEDQNPTPHPLAAAELLNGNWKLLFTTSDELLGINRFPLISLGNIYQCVRIAEGRIYNFAEANTVPYLNGLVSVSARFEAVSEKRVNVKFDRAIFGLQSLLGYQTPNQFIAAMAANDKFNLLKGIDFEIRSDREPGWLEVTYLDEDMRIGRGNQGSVFVLEKVD